MKHGKIILKVNADLVYYFVFGLYCVITTLQNSMIGYDSALVSILASISRYIIILGVGLKIVMRKKLMAKLFILIVAFSLISLIIYFSSNAYLPLIIILLLVGAEGCSDQAIAKTYLLCTGSVIALSMVLSFFGIIEDRLFYRKLLGTMTVRHSHGMTYVTILAAYLFFISAVVIYLKKKVQLIDFAVMFLVVAFMYITMDARLECVSLLALGLVILLLSSWISKNAIIRNVMVYSLIIALAISFLLIGLYMNNPGKYQALNLLLTNRLEYSAKVISDYGFSLFGSAMKMQGWGTVNFNKEIGYYFVDSAYLNYSLQYGLIFTIGLCIFCTYINYKLNKENEVNLLILLTFAALHGIIMSSIFRANMNPLFVIAYAKSSSMKRNTRCLN